MMCYLIKAYYLHACFVINSVLACIVTVSDTTVEFQQKLSISRPHVTGLHAICYNNTRLTAFCPGLLGWACTRKIKPIWIYRSKRQWMTVASAGPYANLLLPQTNNHASIQPLSFYRSDALPAAEAIASKHCKLLQQQKCYFFSMLRWLLAMSFS